MIAAHASIRSCKTRSGRPSLADLSDVRHQCERHSHQEAGAARDHPMIAATGRSTIF